MFRISRKGLASAYLANILLVPVSAWAATLTFGAEMSSIAWQSIIWMLVLSVVCGSAAMLHEMKVELENKGKIVHLWLFVVWRLVGSLAAGIFGYFGATKYGADSSSTALTIMFMSVGGTYLIRRILNAVADKNLPPETGR
jgi:hypothetical protein